MAKFKTGINQMRRKGRENKRAEEKMRVEASSEVSTPQKSSPHWDPLNVKGD